MLLLLRLKLVSLNKCGFALTFFTKNQLHTLEIFTFLSLSFTNYGMGDILKIVFTCKHKYLFICCLSFTGSNLLTIKDEAENSFLLEELSVFVSSVRMVWLNAQFDDDSK